ncbi:MAG: type II secretion system secretin GspD [Thioalkalivibrionaceae bacterium]
MTRFAIYRHSNTDSVASLSAMLLRAPDGLGPLERIAKRQIRVDEIESTAARGDRLAPRLISGEAPEFSGVATRRRCEPTLSWLIRRSIRGLVRRLADELCANGSWADGVGQAAPAARALRRRSAEIRPFFAALVLVAGVAPAVVQAQSAAAGVPQIEITDDDRVVLNLRETEIGTLIDLIAQETETNFIVDPRVRGRVSLISGRPVTRDELMDLFLGALKIYGFSAVPGAGAMRIVPDVQAKQNEIETLPEPGRGVEPPADAVVTDVIVLSHVNAAQLVPILRPLVPQGGHLAAGVDSNTLLIADTAANARRIRELVARMDLPLTPEFEVVELRHARAEALAERLSSLVGSGEVAARARVQVASDPRANALILSGPLDARLAMRGLVAQLDRPTTQGNTRVHYLRYARAEDVAEILRELAEQRVQEADGAPTGGGSVRVRAHESTNSIVLFGPGDVLGDLEDVIERLDIRRAQVLVEAVIAEVSSERARELGVQWGAIGNRAAGLLNFDRQGRGLLQLAAGVEAFLGGAVAAPPNPGDGLSLGGVGQTGSTRIAALVSALQGDSSSNILSTPSVLTLDNEEAEIVVGQNVPFIVGRSIEDSGQAFDTIRREDVGVKLRVRPQINEGDAIRLEIVQEVSQIAQGAAAAADLITNTRTLRTHVIVDDGDILVLGGLIEDSRSDTRDQVPGLGSIPGIGALFRFDSQRSEKRNLMIFLNPRIVRSSGEGTALAAEKYSFIRREQLRDQGRVGRGAVGNLLPEYPLLADLPPSFEELRASSNGLGR